MLVVAVVAVAYGTQAPSLGVAEFAPAARQQLDVPPSTSSADGGGDVRSGKRRPTTTSTTAPARATDSGSSSAAGPTTQVGRSRACVGSPPRQTEDPQAPPCVAVVFEGDNGGGTATGVTGTEIKVALPEGTASDGIVRGLFDYFNLRYEFYGRRLIPVTFPYNVNDPVGQRATADEITAQRVFAALDMSMGSSTPTAGLHITLARNGVISLVGRDVPYSDEMLFDEWHPYVWSVNPSVESIWAASAELVCKALVGRKAAHAGPAFAGQTRRFGVVVERLSTTGVPMPLQPERLVRALQGCGADPQVFEVADVIGEEGRIAVAKMKAAGVTSVLCSCVRGSYYLAQQAMNVGDYEPELLLPDLVASMELGEYYLSNPTYARWARHIFGVHPTPKLLPYQVRPFFTALLSMDPTLNLGSSEAGRFRQLETVYRQLLILASGVQGAGPNLTPDSFGQALMTMEFPNPGAGQAPFWQSSVGFGPGDHTMTDDVALAWWNPTLPGTGIAVISGVGRPGSWCFLGGGARFRAGQIPADADMRFFDPAEPCR